MEHELGHVRKSLYSCTDPTCQYPPFFTVQALRTHAKQQHDKSVPRKSIRKVTAIMKNTQRARDSEAQAMTQPSQERDDSGLVLDREVDVHQNPPGSPSYPLIESKPFFGTQTLNSLGERTSNRIQRSQPQNSLPNVPWAPKIGNSEPTHIGPPAAAPASGSVLTFGQPNLIDNSSLSAQANSSDAMFTNIHGSNIQPEATPVNVPVDSRPEMHIAQVYRARSGEWFDLGTGFCEAKLFKVADMSGRATAALITVRSEFEPAQLLLKTMIYSGDWVQPRLPSIPTIVWRDSKAEDYMGLTFEEEEACARVWETIRQTIDREKLPIAPANTLQQEPKSGVPIADETARMTLPPMSHFSQEYTGPWTPEPQPPQHPYAHHLQSEAGAPSYIFASPESNTDNNIQKQQEQVRQAQVTLSRDMALVRPSG